MKKDARSQVMGHERFWRAPTSDEIKQIARVEIGEPLAYVLGHIPFFDCHIKVNREVLIPRCETEQLVEMIAKEQPRGHLLDLCTGSGCIAIALKKKFPQLLVSASDLYLSEIARENAKINGVDIEFLQGDLRMDGEYDVIVCNPPYVTEEEWQDLEESVRLFEPKHALVGGLAFYQRLAIEAREHLKCDGKLWMEIGSTQGNDVLQLFGSWPNVRLFQDWFGRDRFIFVSK